LPNLSGSFLHAWNLVHPMPIRTRMRLELARNA